MQLRHVPAPRGVHWVRQGVRTVLRQAIGFAALISTLVFALLLLSRLAWIGLALVLVLQPVATLGFMLATKATLDGGRPSPLLFLEPLRGGGTRTWSLLKLGLVHALLTLLLAWVIGAIDSGALDAAMQALPESVQTGPDAVAARFSAPGIGGDVLLRFALMALLSVPFWHAPALIHWAGQGWAQSMFSSTVACWRNRSAFATYLLGWCGLVLALGFVFALLSALPTLGIAAALLTWLVLPTMFYASRYFTFVDCFHASERPPAATPA